MKLFIQSCHAALEYDEARELTDLGYEVGGNFDLGSQQRQKIPGVTDRNSDKDDADLIILHQVPDYCAVMKELLQNDKRVILVSFGQADTWQYEEVGKLCREFPHGYVSAYSQKDFRLHLQHGSTHQKTRLIRFGKYPSDYEEWVGDNGLAYASCNDIHNRGDGCGWEQMDRARKFSPIVLSGKRTEAVGGLGEIPETLMRSMMQHSACFASFGTKPAPWVMTQMEAWMAGCPVVVIDNGCGLREENLPIMIEESTASMANQINRLIKDESYRRSRHEESMEIAKSFDVKVTSPMWKELIEEAMK